MRYDVKRYRRSHDLLQEKLKMLCDFVWSGGNRRTGHFWSIPADRRRDFDCILSDGIEELEDRRKAMAEAGMTIEPWDTEPEDSSTVAPD